MTKLDTVARRHAEIVLAVVADARPPRLEPVGSRRHRRVPGPVWAGIGAAALIVLLFVVPWLLAGGVVDDDVVATTTTTTVPTETVTVGPDGGFVPAGSMTDPGCSWCVAVVLNDGRVLVVGGRNGRIYDPATWTFAPTGSLARSGASDAVLLDDGRVLVAGLPTEGESPYVEIYDSASGESHVIEHQFNIGLAVARLVDGRVLILGTEPAAEGPGLAVTFDPSTDTFTASGPTTAERQRDVRAVPLDDGRVLIVGGSSDARGAEIYDPATGIFSATGSMTFDRGGFTATRLADGRVLIVGGSSLASAETYASAEIYDPASGIFTPTGSMEVPRFWHVAALLPDGRVLVVGGSDSGVRVDQGTFTEIYDPRMGRFTRGPVTTQPRVAATAVSLPSGVLVLGHYPGNFGGNDAAGKTAELFTLGPVERPIGCCPDNPGFISVSSTAARAGRWPTTLVVPAGALEGAVSGSVHIDQLWSGGGSSEESELSLLQCSEGCPISIPLSFSRPADAVMTVRVEIIYRDTPPPQASGITIVIDAEQNG